jgi:hypothetical protein
VAMQLAPRMCDEKCLRKYDCGTGRGGISGARGNASGARARRGLRSGADPWTCTEGPEGLITLLKVPHLRAVPP